MEIGVLKFVHKIFMRTSAKFEAKKSNKESCKNKKISRQREDASYLKDTTLKDTTNLFTIILYNHCSYWQ